MTESNESIQPQAPNVRTPRQATAEEIECFSAKDPKGGLNVIVSNLHVIERWPNYAFTTTDNRAFGIFFDLESVLKRIEAAYLGISWANKADLKQAKTTVEANEVAGFILEISGDDFSSDAHPPFAFKEHTDLALEWWAHHKMYGAPLTDDEYNWLGSILPGLDLVEQEDSEDNQQQD